MYRRLVQQSRRNVLYNCNRLLHGSSTGNKAGVLGGRGGSRSRRIRAPDQPRSSTMKYPERTRLVVYNVDSLMYIS